MKNTIEEAPPGANDALLHNRSYFLAAHAGVIPPKTAFYAQVSAVHELGRGASVEFSESDLEQIAEHMGALAVMQPEITEHGVSDDDLGILLQSRLHERVRNPLISLLISKGAISMTLKQEFGLHIPDSAYDDFLAGLNPDVDTDTYDSDDGGVGVAERQEENDQVSSNPFALTRTLEELRRAFDAHPDKDAEETIAAFNEIICSRVLHKSVLFDESINYYDSLRPALSEEDDGESEIMERIHLALDQKFLARAETFAFSGVIEKLKEHLLGYGLKTSVDHEEYEVLIKRLDDFAKTAFAEEFAKSQPENLSTGKLPGAYIDHSAVMNDEAFERADYSSVELDLKKLSHEDTPAELKDLYAEIFKATDDIAKAKQVFIATVLSKMDEHNTLYSTVYAYAHLRDMVDDLALKAEIAAAHDNQLVIYAIKLDEAGRFTDAYNLLSATRFLLDDGHPTVEKGREIYVKSFNKLREQNITE